MSWRWAQKLSKKTTTLFSFPIAHMFFFSLSDYKYPPAINQTPSWPDHTLSKLTQLTSLTIQDPSVPGAVIAPLTGLQSLTLCQSNIHDIRTLTNLRFVSPPLRLTPTAFDEWSLSLLLVHSYPLSCHPSHHFLVHPRNLHLVREKCDWLGMTRMSFPHHFLFWKTEITTS
jgi:hypothetical protein